MRLGRLHGDSTSQRQDFDEYFTQAANSSAVILENHDWPHAMVASGAMEMRRLYENVPSVSSHILKPDTRSKLRYPSESALPSCMSLKGFRHRIEAPSGMSFCSRSSSRRVISLAVCLLCWRRHRIRLSAALRAAAKVGRTTEEVISCFPPTHGPSGK